MAPNQGMGCRCTPTLYYLIFVLLLMHMRLLISGDAVYGAYEDIAMQLAITASAIIVLRQQSARIDSALATRLTRISQMAMEGLFSVTWGGCAFYVRMNMTAPLVPKWLPPGQVFWGYFTGVCFVAAGLAILTGIQARLAAVLLTVMITIASACWRTGRCSLPIRRAISIGLKAPSILR